MIMVTSDFVAGKTVKKHLGFVKGNTIRARHVGRHSRIRARKESIMKYLILLIVIIFLALLFFI